eukprot:439954_1
MSSLIWFKLLALIYSVNSYCNGHFERYNYTDPILFNHCYTFQNRSTIFFCNITDSTNNIMVVQHNFSTADCNGANSLTIVQDAHNIYCGSDCNTMTIRQYPLKTSNCTEYDPEYDPDTYLDATKIIDHCYIASDTWETTNYKVFCSTNITHGGYWWMNYYADNNCNPDNIVRSFYVMNGCSMGSLPEFDLPHNDSYIELIHCDYKSNDSLLSATEYSKSKAECGHYWTPFDQYNSYHSVNQRKPFDQCNSYHSANGGNFSFQYICNDSYHANYTTDGYTIFKASYNTTNCVGDPIVSLFTDIKPIAIHCNSSNPCDVIKIRDYTIPEEKLIAANISQISECVNMRHNTAITELNEYEYEDQLIISQPCDHHYFVSETINSSSAFTYCTHEFIGTRMYYGDNCEEDRLIGMVLSYVSNICDEHGGIHVYNIDCLKYTKDPTAYPIQYPTIYPTIYQALDTTINHTLTMVSTSMFVEHNITQNKDYTRDKHSFGNGITSRESSVWAKQIIGISVSVMIVLGIVIVLVICYKKSKERKTNKNNVELLQLVEDSDSQKCMHEALTKASPVTIEATDNNN